MTVPCVWVEHWVDPDCRTLDGPTVTIPSSKRTLNGIGLST